MLTPQAVASHAFSKATLGGYNLAQVDEFLDTLTADYTALYNENAILKNKLKVLSETVEEYRATDTAMRKTLLAAQQMADAMVNEAKQKQDELVSEAEKGAQQRVDELQKAIAAEEYRLKQAQESTAAYVRKLAQFHDQEMDFLSHLGELVPPEIAAQAADNPAADIEAAVAAQVFAEEPQQPAPAPPVQKKPARLVAVGPDDDVPPMPDDLIPTGFAPVGDGDDFELDQDATRRLSDIQFGKDYKIK